jgi:hypothetical protein
MNEPLSYHLKNFEDIIPVLDRKFIIEKFCFTEIKTNLFLLKTDGIKSNSRFFKINIKDKRTKNRFIIYPITESEYLIEYENKIKNLLKDIAS